MAIRVKARQTGLTFGVHQSPRPLRECHAQYVRTRFHGNADDEALVDSVMILGDGWQLHRENFDSLVIEQQFGLLGSVQSFHSLVAIAQEPQLHVVFSIQGKGIRNHRSAASADWKLVEMLLLGEVRRKQDGIDAQGRAEGAADGEPADFLRCR